MLDQCLCFFPSVRTFETGFIKNEKLQRYTWLPYKSVRTARMYNLIYSATQNSSDKLSSYYSDVSHCSHSREQQRYSTKKRKLQKITFWTQHKHSKKASKQCRQSRVEHDAGCDWDKTVQNSTLVQSFDVQWLSFEIIYVRFRQSR